MPNKVFATVEELRELKRLRKENAELKLAIEAALDGPQLLQNISHEVRRRTNTQNKAYGRAAQAIFHLRNEVRMLRSAKGLENYEETFDTLEQRISDLTDQNKNLQFKVDRAEHAKAEKALAE